MVVVWISGIALKPKRTGSFDQPDGTSKNPHDLIAATYNRVIPISNLIMQNTLIQMTALMLCGAGWRLFSLQGLSADQTRLALTIAGKNT